MRISRQTLIIIASSVLALAVLIGGAFFLTRHAGGGQPSQGSGTTKASGQVVSPFTGEPVTSLRRVLIFKIDNVAQARPPTGLGSADIVYLLPVDGGLSRIMAVFSSHVPPVAGPVRSAREEDLKLLRQFGTPAFAFSGAQPALVKVVEHARIVDLYDSLVGGYFRSPARAAPYNLYARARQLYAEGKGASLARDIGFRFGAAPAGGDPVSRYNVSYPAAGFSFRWSATQGRWLAWMDGRPATAAGGGVLGARTVVVQYTKVRTSVFRELGVRPPYAETVGSGQAVVLRGGRAYHVRWSRPRADGGTAFTLPDGHRMTFARGQVWVVFAYGPGSTAPRG